MDANRTNTNRRGAATRQRLLDAGLELFRELSVAELLQALSPRTVSARAGVTTGAFYNHFADHAAYADALAEYGLSRQPADDRLATDTVARAIEYANAPDTHLVNDMRELLDFNFELSIAEIGVLEFVLAMWTRRRDPRIMELLRRRYLFQAEYASAQEVILRRWNVWWRAPFTHEMASTIITCIAEGMHVRHCIEPESLPKESFAHTVLAFAAGALEPVVPPDAAEQLDDFLGHQGIRDWEPPDDGGVRRPSKAIVDAAIELLSSVDMDTCSVEDIARHAGVSVPQVYAAWGSRARLATAVVAQLCEPIRGQLAIDLDLPMPGLRALDRQLGRLAALYVDLARRRPMLLSLALRGAIEHLLRPPEHAGHVGLALVPAIEAGQRDGSIQSDVEAREVSRSLASAHASRALRKPETSPEELLTFVRSIWLRGVATKRASIPGLANR